MITKISTLCWFDILILTIILFGWAIYSSMMEYFALAGEVVTLDENLAFSSWQNYEALFV